MLYSIVSYNEHGKQISYEYNNYCFGTMWRRFFFCYYFANNKKDNVPKGVGTILLNCFTFHVHNKNNIKDVGC